MPSSISGDANVSATEFGYLDGVTSAIQTQLSARPTGTTGAWTDYTPVLTAATTNPTLGTGSSATGAYAQIGKVVFVRYRIIFGTSGVNAGSGEYRISVPVASNSVAVGHGSLSSAMASFLYDSSTGNTVTSAFPSFITSTTFSLSFNFSGSLSSVSNLVPWTWAASDQIVGGLTYEAA